MKAVMEDCRRILNPRRVPPENCVLNGSYERTEFALGVEDLKDKVKVVLICPSALFQYAVLLVIIFILEISAGIAGYVYHGEVETEVKKMMTETQAEYTKSGGDKAKVWDTIQKEFKCCGVSNYTEWKPQFENSTTQVVPASCCKSTSNCNGTEADINADKIYKEGCLTKFETFVKDNVFIIGGVGIGLAFVQVKMISRKSIMGSLFSVEPNSEN
uniref:CD63 antigen n=1 Tax=Magallana gigas TaxID=29159 RepID=K1Q8Q8_MAGGI